MVPGHEMIGTETEVGFAVTKFKPGDTVGVGAMVRSCLQCDDCDKGLQRYCDKVVPPYNSVYSDGTLTQGGYSNMMIADHRYAISDLGMYTIADLRALPVVSVSGNEVSNLVPQVFSRYSNPATVEFQ